MGVMHYRHVCQACDARMRRLASGLCFVKSDALLSYLVPSVRRQCIGMGDALLLLIYLE